MKKIFAMLVVTLAVGFNANAQKKAATTAVKPAAETTQETPSMKAAKEDLAALKQVITFKDEAQEGNYLRLFERKHRYNTEDPNLTAERKATISKSIEAKMKSGLSPDQIEKIESTPGLMKRLTSL